MRYTLIVLFFMLAASWLSMRLIRPNHPPGGAAALPLPPLEKVRTGTLETATFALG